MFLRYLAVFFIAMIPLIELRGAIPIAIGMGLDTIPSIVTCALGNLLPVPLIYYFARKVLIWGEDKPLIGPFCRFCHSKGAKASRRLSGPNYRKFGILAALILFVGIPIPGTGAWTGTLGASFLDMSPRSTFFGVTVGIIIAGFIMSSVSMVGMHVFGL